MRKLFTTFAALVLTLLAASCAPFDDSDANYKSGGVGSGLFRKFWAVNTVTNISYQLEAVKLATGEHCVIWAERSRGIKVVTAEEMVAEYDNKIYQKMLDTFGRTGDFTDNGKVVAKNTLEYADWMGDGDGKLAILLLDIKDSYTTGNGYVAGYFWSGNFYDRGRVPTSNAMDMIYVDLNPGILGSLESNSTFAHELQHLMNYATAFSQNKKNMDLWLDEGLSTAAEYVYLGQQVESRIDWFNKDVLGTIARGNNFYCWNNHEEEASSVLDDYASAYLFFQWLRIQYGDDIYKNIIASNYTDYRAVTTAAGKGTSSDDWTELLGTWLRANYVNAPSGLEGYKGEVYPLPRVWAVEGGIKTLVPGEAVYTIGSSVPVDEGNVKFSKISKGTPGTDPSRPNTGDRILMYNANAIADKDLKETNTVIGSGEAKPSLSNSSVRGAAGETGKGFAIGIGDMLRQNGHEDWGGANLSGLPRVRIASAED